MAEFEIAFDETMLHEGGYVDDPDDRGGETYRGVARKFHQAWPGWKIVAELNREKPDRFADLLDQKQELQTLVASFYREQFWRPIRGEQLSDQALANELFDTAVNQGVGTAIRFWQEALNLLNRNAKDYPEIEVDGVAGERTLATTNQFLQRNRGQSDRLLKVLNLQQGARYLEIARKNPVQRKFLHGWLNRIR
ncbi:MAG: glycoside hydrolase family 108 protein, partial [Planctomycetota bacterium]